MVHQLSPVHPACLSNLQVLNSAHAPLLASAKFIQLHSASETHAARHSVPVLLIPKSLTFLSEAEQLVQCSGLFQPFVTGGGGGGGGGAGSGCFQSNVAVELDTFTNSSRCSNERRNTPRSASTTSALPFGAPSFCRYAFTYSAEKMCKTVRNFGYQGQLKCRNAVSIHAKF